MKPERGTIDAARAILGLPERSVQDLAARGQIPGAAKFGRRWTFDLEKLRRYVKQKERRQWQSAKHRLDAIGAAIPFGAASVTAAATSDGRFTRVTRRLRGNAARRAR
jgi:hypothetical protein